MERFFGSFTCLEDVMGQFEVVSKDMEDVHILAAEYTQESYDGSAMVVFRKEGKLYEVHGSHCSCNGLEGQWNPEETTAEALLDRICKTQEYVERDHGMTFHEALRKGLIDEIFEKEVLLKK